jgi:uncharacterized protein (TIGR00369 family)
MPPDADLTRSFGAVPINDHFRFRLEASSLEQAAVSLEPRAAFRQETGVVHGGVLATLADTAAVYLFFPFLPAGGSMASIEFKLNFLAPAAVDGERLLARARVVRRGTRVGVCEVEVSQAERLVAKGLFTYLFLEAGGGSR